MTYLKLSSLQFHTSTQVVYNLLSNKCLKEYTDVDQQKIEKKCATWLGLQGLWIGLLFVIKVYV